MRKIALTALKAEVFLSQYKLCHGAVALAMGWEQLFLGESAPTLGPLGCLQL